MQDLLSESERCPLDATIDDLVDAKHFERANALREVPSDQFGIGDNVADGDTRNELGMEIGFFKPCEKAFAELLMPFGKKFTMEGELLGVFRIGVE